jgi:hypothetical protein
MNAQAIHRRAAVFVAAALYTVAACTDQEAPSGSSDGGAAAAMPADPSLDANAITAITGGKPEVSGNVTKINFPRTDVSIEVDGWKNVPPFMGLTSYAAFMPHGGAAMMMGDVVLLEDEVNPAMSAALDHGLQVTALHNHFFYAKPAVYFMHIGGMGSADDIAKGVKATLEAARSVRVPAYGRSRSNLKTIFVGAAA